MKGRRREMERSMTRFRSGWNPPNTTGQKKTIQSDVAISAVIAGASSFMVHSPGVFVQQRKQPVQSAIRLPARSILQGGSPLSDSIDISSERIPCANLSSGLQEFRIKVFTTASCFY